MGGRQTYFCDFADMSRIAVRTADRLSEMFTNFDAQKLSGWLDELHAMESEGDRRKHKIMNALARDFVTPIERDDLIRLASELDDVIDMVEDVLIKVYMYNIRSIKPEAIKMAKIVVLCCHKLHEVIEELPNFRKSKTLMGGIVEINRLEEDGDRLYIGAVRALYSEDYITTKIFAWTEVFRQLESCCDACEHAADIVEGIAMKNT